MGKNHRHLSLRRHLPVLAHPRLLGGQTKGGRTTKGPLTPALLQPDFRQPPTAGYQGRARPLPLAGGTTKGGETTKGPTRTPLPDGLPPAVLTLTPLCRCSGTSAASRPSVHVVAWEGC